MLVLFRSGVTSFRLVTAACLALACLLPLAAGTRRFVDAFLRASAGVETIGELLYFHEGAVDTVAIVRREYGFWDPDAKSLITNGVAMAATVKPVWRYMSLEGHLPCCSLVGLAAPWRLEWAPESHSAPSSLTRSWSRSPQSS